MNYQPGIIAPITDHAIFLEYGITNINISSIGKSLEALSEELKDTGHVTGIGSPLAEALNVKIPGLNKFPDYSDAYYDIPVTQNALFVILRGDEPNQLGELANMVSEKVSEAFQIADKTKGFKYQGGRDLTGYEDGTENPEGKDALEAAFFNEESNPLHGSSYVAIQRWKHDFNRFDAMHRDEQDKRIGRYRSTNEEFDSPRYAHVKKTAQESFDPEAFVLRRSMPWSDERGRGLFFIAFGNSLRAFDVQMKSMMGVSDGIHDGLFDFTIPTTGGNYWCPPVQSGKLDLSLVLN